MDNEVTEIVVSIHDVYLDTVIAVSCFRILYPEAKVIRRAAEMPRTKTTQTRVCVNTGIGWLNPDCVALGVARVVWAKIGQSVIEVVLDDLALTREKASQIWNMINGEIMTPVDHVKFFREKSNTPTGVYGVINSHGGAAEHGPEGYSDKVFFAAVETANLILRTRIKCLYEKLEVGLTEVE